MTPLPTTHRLAELDGVRGIASIFILLLHCFFGLISLTPGTWIASIVGTVFPFLIGGVDLFFVLSGFLIGGILIDSRGKPRYFKNFWARRAARILPVNLVLVASYALALLVQQHFQFSGLDITALAKPNFSPLWYATFTQSIPLTQAWGAIWVAPTWSLAIEEQFYLLFPLVVYLISRRQLTALSILAVVISTATFAGVAYVVGREDTAYVLLPCRMYGLFLGVIVALIIRDDIAVAFARRHRLWIDLVALLLVWSIHHQWITTQYFRFLNEGRSLLAALFHQPLSYLEISVLFALLLLRIFLYDGGLFRAILRHRFFTAGGAISFALYMYHQPVNGTLHGLIFDHAPTISNAAELSVSILVMLISALLAALSYFYLEHPIRRFVHERIKRQNVDDLVLEKSRPLQR
jgi:peptidoglycan/LPS O-acetylase OafA/YrhL